MTSSRRHFEKSQFWPYLPNGRLFFNHIWQTQRLGQELTSPLCFDRFSFIFELLYHEFPLLRIPDHLIRQTVTNSSLVIIYSSFFPWISRAFISISAISMAMKFSMIIRHGLVYCMRSVHCDHSTVTSCRRHFVKFLYQSYLHNRKSIMTYIWYI